MIISPKTLCFLTTLKCTAACANCCFSCSPKRTEFLSTHDMHKYIDQALEIPSIVNVVFSGGECFLLGKDLDALIQHVTNNNLYSRVVSNAFWAKSYKIAKERLALLVKSGLKEVNFSTGDNHSKYVPVQNIINASLACVEFGIKPYIMLEMFKNSTFDIDMLFTNEEFNKAFQDEKIDIAPSVWMQFGKTQSIVYSEKQLSENFDLNCTSIFNDLSIDTKNQLNACCGLPSKEIPELILGTLNGKTIKQVLESAKDDFIKIWLNIGGPREIIDYARSIDKSIPKYSNALHICDLCRHAYADPKIRKAYQTHKPEHMKEKLTVTFLQHKIIDNISSSLSKKEKMTKMPKCPNKILVLKKYIYELQK